MSAEADDAVAARAAVERLRRFGGERLLRDMGAIFLDALPEGLATARRALAEGDAAGVGQVAHSLKSSAGQMGAVVVERLCQAMEAASRTGDLPALAALLGEAEREGAAYARWLGGELERPPGGGPAPDGAG